MNSVYETGTAAPHKKDASAWGFLLTSVLREVGTTKTIPVQPSNLPASQKESAAAGHYLSHALETPFP